MKDVGEKHKYLSRKCFDKSAVTYATGYYGKHASELYDIVVRKVFMASCMCVLDVGCGTGSILEKIASKSDACLSGIDLSENMLEIAKQKLGNKADLRIGDSEYLPWEDNKFDTIICTDSFHHYPSPGKVLDEMYRVLSKGGRLIIADPWWPFPIRHLINMFLPYGKDGDVKIYSEKEIRKLLNESGFDLVTWEKASKNSFIVIAEKNEK